MATARTMKATIRRENGHQVIVLPDEIQFDGDVVYVQRNDATGDLTVSGQPHRRTWQELFAAIDAHGPIADDAWDAYTSRIQEARLSKSLSDIFRDGDTG